MAVHECGQVIFQHDLCTHVCVCVPLIFSVCVCVYKFVSLCVCLLRCSCFVPLMRGVQGLHGGLCKISFSCFAMKALLQRNRRNSLKWRRARLNYSAFTINFCRRCPHTSPRLASRHLLGPQSLRVHHGNVDPARRALWPRDNTSGCGSVDLCLQVSLLN